MIEPGTPMSIRECCAMRFTSFNSYETHGAPLRIAHWFPTVSNPAKALTYRLASVTWCC